MMCCCGGSVGGGSCGSAGVRNEDTEGEDSGRI